MNQERINALIAESIPPEKRWWNSRVGGPNFCNDLNAMHIAEELLTDGDASKKIDDSRFRYRFYLCEILNVKIAKDWWLVLHATAMQRAEAFLRTIEKWKGCE